MPRQLLTWCFCIGHNHLSSRDFLIHTNLLVVAPVRARDRHRMLSSGLMGLTKTLMHRPTSPRVRLRPWFNYFPPFLDSKRTGCSVARPSLSAFEIPKRLLGIPKQRVAVVQVGQRRQSPVLVCQNAYGSLQSSKGTLATTSLLLNAHT